MGHRLGQVFLHDKQMVEKIVRLSGLTAAETCVEIGCGDGILSAALSQCCDQLHIFEIDPECIKNTLDRLGDKDNVFAHLGDVLDADFSRVPCDKFRLVANVPYYISAKIVKHLIKYRHRLMDATLMFQDEFAQKLLANPGEALYTSLSVYCAYFFESEKLVSVPRTCFKPQPRVDSLVLKLTPRVSLPFSIDDRFFDMVRTGFWGRRKPLRSALDKGPYIQLEKGFKSVPFFSENPTIRAEKMGLEDFYELYQQIEKFIVL